MTPRELSVEDRSRQEYLKELSDFLWRSDKLRHLLDRLLDQQGKVQPKDLGDADSVRVDHKRLVNQVKTFNRKAADKFGVRLHLTESPYQVSWVSVPRREPDVLVQSPHTSPVHTFWDAYLKPRQRVVLMISTPLFWRHPEGRRYIRDFDANDPAQPPAEGLTPSYHYLSVGDVWSAFRITEKLQRTEPTVYFKHVKAREWKPANSAGQRIIAVGNSRNNAFIGEWQAAHKMRVEAKHVTDSRGSKRHPEYDTGRTVEYAVVTRFRDDEDRVVTMLSSNHGTATFAAAEYLTNEEKIQELLDTFRMEKLPEKFQLLFKVDVVVQDLFGHAELEEASWD